jgi:hypothetical protein
MRRALLLAGLALLTALCGAGSAAAATTVQIIPALPGIHLTFDGQRLTSGPDGAIVVPTDDQRALRARLQVLNTTVRHAVHARFRGWRRGRLTLTLLYHVRAVFVDPRGRRVDPRRIRSVLLKGPGNVRIGLDTAHPTWVPGNRIVSIGRRPVSRDISWAVERVIAAGANVVARSQQRFVPSRVRHPRVHVRFYTLRFAVRDALLGSGIGSEIRLRYPDGSVERHPLGPGGHFTFQSVPRGAYTVEIKAAGFASVWPVTLAGNQALSVSVISYLDVLLVLGGLLAIALGLLLVGRRRVRRAA